MAADIPRASSTQNQLIIKVGNTNVVAALFKEDVVIRKLRLDYIEGWEWRLAAGLKDMEINVALIGSVNPKIYEAVLRALDFLPREKIFDAKKDLLALEVLDPSLPHVEAWGADILANAHGVRVVLPGRDVLVVDIGTAVTDTSVSAEGYLKDVFIAPGFEASVKALALGTAEALPSGFSVPAFKRPEDDSKGHEIDVVFNGIYWRFIGGCKKTYEVARERFFPGKDVAFVVTGGVTTPPDDISGYVPANDLSKRLRSDLATAMPSVVFCPDLTLIGLREILKRILATKA